MCQVTETKHHEVAGVCEQRVMQYYKITLQAFQFSSADKVCCQFHISAAVPRMPIE